MVIKLLPVQIPALWDAIKYASTAVETIPEKDRQLYFNRLLHSLLNDKAQCFVRMDENRRLLALAITRITQDEVTGEKSLFVNCLYSFQSVDGSQWQSDMDFIKQFAIQTGCKKITSYSNNERVFELVTSIGFTERYRCFIMEI